MMITMTTIMSIMMMREENEWLKKENDRLKQQLETTLKQNKVFIERLSSGIKSEIESSDAACNHYTGFPTVTCFAIH